MSAKSKVLTVLLVVIVAALSPVVAEAQMRRPGPPPLLVIEGRASSDSTTHPLRIIVGPRPGQAPSGDDESSERPPLGGVVLIGRGRPLLLDDVDCTFGEPVGAAGEDDADEDTATDEDEDAADEADAEDEDAADGSARGRQVVTALTASVCIPPRRGEEAGELEAVGTLSLTIEPLTLDDGRVVPHVTGTVSFTDREGNELSFTIDGRPLMPGPRPGRRGSRSGGEDVVEESEAEQIEGDDVGSAVEDF